MVKKTDADAATGDLTDGSAALEDSSTSTATQSESDTEDSGVSGIDGTEDASDGSDDSAASDTADTADTTDSSKSLPFHDHPRWKEVMGERDSLKGERDSLKAEIEQLKAGELKKDTTPKEPMPPKMQQWADQIKEDAKKSMFEDLAKMQQENQERQVAVDRETKKLVSDLKKEVGSEELFKESFAPFAKDFLTKFPGVSVTKKSLTEMVGLWRQSGLDKSNLDRVSSPSLGKGREGGFKIDKNASFADDAERFMKESGMT